MKTAVVNRTNLVTRPNLPYPNAATKRQVIDRFVELLLMATLGIGAAAIILFLLALA
jgi:hypothetical protein